MHFTSFKRGLFCAFAAALTIGAAYAADPLHVAVEPMFAPFEIRNAHTGELEGYEIDICKEISKRMGRELAFVTYKFDAILPAVMTGAVDFAASGFSITEERKKKVAFTAPHYRSGIAVIVRKGEGEGIKSFDDLRGRKVAVQLGSISHDRAKSIDGIKLTTFDTVPEAFLDLQAGNVDAVINSLPATGYMLKTKPALSKHLELLPVSELSSGMALVTSKENKALLAELDKNLAAMKADGTVEALQVKWFGQTQKLDY